MRLKKLSEMLFARVENLIPQMEKSEIVQHFAIEGIARRTIYYAINRQAYKQPNKDTNWSWRPTSWTSEKTSKLKRLVKNHFRVSRWHLGKKFGVHQTTILRQLAKMSISYHKRE